MKYTQITFPEVRLQARDGHKLRGYFGRLFESHSTLLHNHEANGRLRYAYPLVQYKVLEGTPTVVGLGAGSALLTDLFLEIEELDIDGTRLPIHSKQIHNQEVEAGVQAGLFRYRFVNPWMALNQDNFRRYCQMEEEEKGQFLHKILTNHLVAVVKALGGSLAQPILLSPQLSPLQTRFKDQKMEAFHGSFVCNVLLPDAVGIGKSVSRGFGAVRLVPNGIQGV
jgi:hypothetical protein